LGAARARRWFLKKIKRGKKQAEDGFVVGWATLWDRRLGQEVPDRSKMEIRVAKGVSHPRTGKTI